MFSLEYDPAMTRRGEICAAMFQCVYAQLVPGTSPASCCSAKTPPTPAVGRQKRDGPTTAQMCLAIIHDTTNKNETCMRPGGTITRFCVMNLFPSYVHVYTEYYDPLIVICWSCCCGIQL